MNTFLSGLRSGVLKNIELSRGLQVIKQQDGETLLAFLPAYSPELNPAASGRHSGECRRA